MYWTACRCMYVHMTCVMYITLPIQSTCTDIYVIIRHLHVCTYRTAAMFSWLGSETSCEARMTTITLHVYIIGRDHALPCLTSGPFCVVTFTDTGGPLPALLTAVMVTEYSVLGLKSWNVCEWTVRNRSQFSVVLASTL